MLRALMNLYAHAYMHTSIHALEFSCRQANWGWKSAGGVELVVGGLDSEVEHADRSRQASSNDGRLGVRDCLGECRRPAFSASRCVEDCRFGERRDCGEQRGGIFFEEWENIGFEIG